MTRILKTWWPAVLVLALAVAVLLYGRHREEQGRKAVETAVKVEKLEAENEAQKQDIQVRKKQNEIRNRDITAGDLDRILRAHSF